MRFTALAVLATELQEVEGRRELARVVGRYVRIELVALDELGYLALLEGAAELVFQVVSEALRARQLDRDQQPALRRVGQDVPRPALAKPSSTASPRGPHLERSSESCRFRHRLTTTSRPDVESATDA